jgi:N-methylhydantoinase B
MSIRHAYRLTEAEAVLQVRADRHTFRPYGLYGGAPGKPSRNRLIANGQERELTAKATLTPMRRGNVFIYDQPGPRRLGRSPRARSAPGAARRGERAGQPGLRARDYGVVIDAAALVVDEAATARRRAELRAACGWATAPVVSR